MKNWKAILQSNIFFLFLFFFLFFYCLFMWMIPRKSHYVGDETIFTGIILDYHIDGDALKILLQGKEKLQVNYTISSEVEKEQFIKDLGYGKSLTIEGELVLPEENALPNTFNYKQYLYYQHIYYILKAKKFAIAKQENIFYFLKNQLRKHFHQFKSEDYLLSFLFGDSFFLDKSKIQKNGISHLFAISGMHFSLFVLAFDKVFQKMKGKKIILFSFLLFYLFLVRFTVSALRVFLLLFLEPSFRKLSYSPRKRLFLVFSILLFIEPFFLFQIGFQYSFLVSFGLTFLMKKNHYWSSLFSMSFYSFLVSLPITAMHYFEINFLSIILNLLFVPFVSFFLYPFCFILLLCPILDSVFLFFASCFELFNTWFANISFFTIVIPKTFFLFWGIYYIFLFLYFSLSKKRYFFFLCLLLCGMKGVPKIDSSSYVYFLDVGQGDSALFISPYQKEILFIDTGGKIVFSKKEWQKRKNVYEDDENMITFFHSLGIEKINYLILTHGDADHTGNAMKILDQIFVTHIVMNRNQMNFIEQEIKAKYPEKIMDDIQSQFFQIEEFTQTIWQEENDSSLIYQIGIFGYQFLMMGDASSKIEKRLLSKNIESHVIKIGHHGSKTSSDISFLKKVNPDYAIISVGENNRYHHPSKETLETLKNLKIPYYMTSTSKTIVFKITKNFLSFYSNP